VFDKVRQVKPAEVISNKRLGVVLKVIQDNSKSAPKRHGQRASTFEKYLLNSLRINRKVLSDNTRILDGNKEGRKKL